MLSLISGLRVSESLVVHQVLANTGYSDIYIKQHDRQLLNSMIVKVPLLWQSHQKKRDVICRMKGTENIALGLTNELAF